MEKEKFFMPFKREIRKGRIGWVAEMREKALERGLLQ